jgi:hypothetical protein
MRVTTGGPHRFFRGPAEFVRWLCLSSARRATNAQRAAVRARLGGPPRWGEPVRRPTARPMPMGGHEARPAGRPERRPGRAAVRQARDDAAPGGSIRLGPVGNLRAQMLTVWARIGAVRAGRGRVRRGPVGLLRVEVGMPWVCLRVVRVVRVPVRCVLQVDLRGRSAVVRLVSGLEPLARGAGRRVPIVRLRAGSRAAQRALLARGPTRRGPVGDPRVEAGTPQVRRPVARVARVPMRGVPEVDLPARPAEAGVGSGRELPAPGLTRCVPAVRLRAEPRAARWAPRAVQVAGTTDRPMPGGRGRRRASEIAVSRMIAEGFLDSRLR